MSILKRSDVLQKVDCVSNTVWYNNLQFLLRSYSTKIITMPCSINSSVISTYVCQNMIYTLFHPYTSYKFTAILLSHIQLCWYYPVSYHRKFCNLFQYVISFSVGKQWRTSKIFHILTVVSSGRRHWLHCLSKCSNIWCSWTPETEVMYKIQAKKTYDKNTKHITQNVANQPGLLFSHLLPHIRTQQRWNNFQ